MGASTWLCPTELDRARVVDNSERVRRARLAALGAVGVALIALGPWVGWWTLALFAASAVNLLTLDRWIARTDRPERAVAFTYLFTEALIAVGVAFSGAGQSPALPWMAVPVGLAAARFRRRVVFAGLVVGVAMMLAATVGVDPGSLAHEPTLFIVSLALMASVVSIVVALQSAEVNYRSQSVLDPLTGLLNRTALAQRFAELEQQARITGGSVCMIAIDLDGFKQINDVHGHDLGDGVLRDVAYEMRRALRSFELFYRLGGEEFLVVLPGVQVAEGLAVAERLRRAVERARPAEIRVTVSLGVAAASGAAVTYGSLFREADLALYQAKERGRNRAVAWGINGEPTMPPVDDGLELARVRLRRPALS